MSKTFALYTLGFILILTGATYGLVLLGIDTKWIVAVGLLLGGVGLIYAVQMAQDDHVEEERIEAVKKAREEKNHAHGSDDPDTKVVVSK